MKLSVGIIEPGSAWEVLLKQIGLSFQSIKIDELAGNRYPIVIIDKIKDDYKSIVMEYLNSGGFIITETANAKRLFNIPVKKRKIKYFYTEKEDLFDSNIYCDIKSVMQIPSDANHLNDQDKEKTVLIKNMGKGLIVILPEGLLRLIFSVKNSRKRFYSGYSPELPTEQVSSVGKGDLSNILYKIFEYLFHKKNLPFVRLWHLPNGSESLFGFRVDTDFANDADIENLYQVISENNISASWLVETLSRKQDFNIFRSFKNQEIGLHCYRHKIYSDMEENIKDIEKGMKALKENGFSPQGYASPFGEWNIQLAAALEKFQFNYSSEFSYAFDSLPLYPLINNSVSKVLQIPIHPVSVGRLRWAKHTEEGMLNYFLDIIEKKKNDYEPIILYTHPSQKRLNIFEAIFKRINELKIPVLSFNEYAGWWKEREKVVWEPEMINNKAIVKSSTKSKSIWIHVSSENGKNYLAPITAEDLNFVKEIQPKKNKLFPNFNPEILNKKSLSLVKQNIIYNYRKMKQ